MNLIKQRLDREAKERRKDIYDYAVKLLSKMRMMSSEQDLVFRKEIGMFDKEVEIRNLRLR